jgi:exopolysaccharide biosynthesis polyprenyl glycosylphosphotransferase
MTEAKRRLLLNLLKLFDLGLLVVSFGLSAIVVHVRHGLSLTHFLSMRVKLGNFVLFGAIVLAWHAVFFLCGMYGSKRLSTRRSEIVEELLATTMCVACLALLSSPFSVSVVTIRFVLVFWILGSCFVVSGRLALRYFLNNIRRRGHNLRYMLILGTNERALTFAQRIEARPELGYRILGFVDEEWKEGAGFKKSGLTLACDFRSLPEFLRNNVVDEVANYLPLRSFYEHCAEVAALCQLHGIILRFSSDIFGLEGAKPLKGELDASYYPTAYPGVRDGLPMMMKRLLDTVGSIALIIVLAPVLAMVAMAIKLTSDGSVFFLQERMGYNKRKFLIYKFRTMIPNAEKMMAELEDLNEVSGPAFKMSRDPRITRIGRFLRRTCIDELPQLINVLNGDMSLVGPRPLPVRDYHGFSEDWQRRRFSVKPGMTCLWQIAGRETISFEEWMKLDLKYLDEWSLWLDLKILVRTIPAVVRGSGAV